MTPYFPDPNPPGEPKPCQECQATVDGDDTEGWWLEHEAWQGPNYYWLLCLPCVVERMHDRPEYPAVDDEAEARTYLE